MDWFILAMLYLTGRASKKVEERDDPAGLPQISWSKDLSFAKGDPVDFESYKGQEKVKEILQLVLDSVHTNPRTKIMLVGPKGTGKTALARIIANMYISNKHLVTNNSYKNVYGKYMEVTPAMVGTKSRLDNMFGTLNLWDVLFIDEIHMLERQLADTLLPALQDNVYPFNSGMASLPEDYTVIGATTDVGLLPEAFQDRFQLIFLEPLGLKDLANIVKMQPFSATEDACLEIARRSAGYPREVKRIYVVAKNVASTKFSPIINMDHALEAFRLLDLDIHGLYPQERLVLQTLFRTPKYFAPKKDGTLPKRYAQSESTIRTITGLDSNFYKQIESKLMRLGYLTISSSGRELTELAHANYFRNN